MPWLRTIDSVDEYQRCIEHHGWINGYHIWILWIDIWILCLERHMDRHHGWVDAFNRLLNGRWMDAGWID